MILISTTRKTKKMTNYLRNLCAYSNSALYKHTESCPQEGNLSLILIKSGSIELEEIINYYSETLKDSIIVNEGCNFLSYHRSHIY